MASVIDSPFDYVPRLNFRAGEGCEGDADCPEGDTCASGKCHQKCKTDGDCPSYQHCRGDLYDGLEHDVCGKLRTSVVGDLQDIIRKRNTPVQPEGEVEAVGIGLGTSLLVATALVGGAYVLFKSESRVSRVRNRLRRDI